MRLAAQPELVTPVLQVVQRVVARRLLQAVGLEADEGHAGAVTLIQRFGSAANLNIGLRGERVYESRLSADGKVMEGRWRVDGGRSSFSLRRVGN